MKALIDADFNKLFTYDRGCLYWAVDRGNFKCKGKRAGVANSSGRLCVQVNNKKYLIHRIIYYMFNEYLPDTLDHINGDYLDNRIENLREATVSENQYNSKLRTDNSSGFKNVYLDKRRGTWYVQMNKDSKVHMSCMYKTKEEAIKRASEMRRDLHADFGKG